MTNTTFSLDLLDFLSPEDGGTGMNNYQPVTHIITADMATLCRENTLDAWERGDRCSIRPHRKGKGWRAITCPWCRSLGYAYYDAVMKNMRGPNSATP